MKNIVICCFKEIKYFFIEYKSLGCVVPNDFFCGFYIHVLTNEQAFICCRSPPIDAFLKIRIDWRFFMSDIVLARFIKYMEVVLIHKRIDYIRKISKINEFEEELTDYKVKQETISEREFLDLDVLNKKEKELLELLYVKGFSYKEISKLTNVSVKALELRRYRAIQKLKSKMGEV